MSPDEQETLLSALDCFLDENVIAEVMEPVRGGKEATVYRCRNARPSPPFFAAKIYRDAGRRSFRNDSMYRNGRVIGPPRIQRAVANRSEFGREVAQYLWVAAEYETQGILHASGVSVPRPIARRGNVILMEWIGDADG